MRLLLCCQADPLATDVGHDTSLLAAVSVPRQGERVTLAVLRHLLAVSRRPVKAISGRGRLGKTVLHHACLYGYREVFNLVMQAIRGGANQAGCEANESANGARQNIEVDTKMDEDKGGCRKLARKMINEDHREERRVIDKFLNAIDVNGGTALSLAVQGQLL